MKLTPPYKLAVVIAVLVALIQVILMVIISDLSNKGVLLFSLLIFAVTFLIVYFVLVKQPANKILTSETANNENEKLNEIKRLKETEQFRKEFIGNLAHELKTPVFSVQGYILTLLEGGLEDETINRKFLKKASKGIDRIATVIEDIDTITRIESGTLMLDKKKFSIGELIKEVFEDLEEVAQEKNITLTKDKKEDANLSVFADKSKITQVLANLILNSINYGNVDGKTVVSVKSQKGKILIEVIDDGPGIENIHLSRLFERFYRVEKSRSRNKGGSGIGLAIVKHIIEAHQENISVKSEVDKGTTFSFCLPKV
jgi:two-component system phosphate regulon sensor histidine kinase PhoR